MEIAFSNQAAKVLIIVIPTAAFLLFLYHWLRAGNDDFINENKRTRLPTSPFQSPESLPYEKNYYLVFAGAKLQLNYFTAKSFSVKKGKIDHFYNFIFHLGQFLL